MRISRWAWAWAWAVVVVGDERQFQERRTGLANGGNDE